MKIRKKLHLFAAALTAILCLAICHMPFATTATERIFDKYASIPKGIILEGTATGLPPIKNISYSAESNSFKINNEYTYKNPVSQSEFSTLLKAIMQDDRVGVSLTLTDDEIVYGKLSSRDRMVRDMIGSDRILGGVTFGVRRYTRDRKLPDDYQPLRQINFKPRLACCYIFDNYRFVLKEKDVASANNTKKDDSNSGQTIKKDATAEKNNNKSDDKKSHDGNKTNTQKEKDNKTENKNQKDKTDDDKKSIEREKDKSYVRAGFDFNTLIVPLKEELAKDGGHTPDEKKLRKDGVYDENVQKNLEHIKKHQKDYMEMDDVKKTVAIGEAASFIRFLIQSKIDLGKLTIELKSQRKKRWWRKD